MVGAENNSFLSSHPEKLMMNQYWFSQHTIEAMVADLEEYGTKVAHLLFLPPHHANVIFFNHE